MAPTHSEVMFLDDCSDDDLLGMDLADVISLDKLDFSDNGPGSNSTCSVDKTFSKDNDIDVDNAVILDHDNGKGCNAYDVFVIPSDDEESSADDNTADSNSGTNAVSKKKRGSRKPYNYWHSDDEFQIIEADGMLRKKRKYRGRKVPASALIRELKKGPLPIIYRGKFSESRVRRKREHLMENFRKAVQMGDKYKPINTHHEELYNRCTVAWPHIIEEADGTVHKQR